MLLSRLLSTFVIVAAVSNAALPVATPLGFRTEMNVLHSSRAPFTGALVFKVNENGTLTGVYQADSIRPDPLYGRQTPVTGTLSGDRIRIQIGNGTNAIVISGSTNGHSITGSSSMRNAVWTFTAERVHLKNPPQQT